FDVSAPPARAATRSLHRWDHELGAFLGARRPARRYGFGFSVEAHRVGAVLVEIAEAGTLPSAEGVVGKWHRYREVHSHHADIDAVGEIARGIAVAGEDGDAVAVVVLGGKLQRLLVVLGAHHRKHRAENLLLVDAHVRRHLVEQTAAHEEALLVALQLEATAVDLQLGAFLEAEIDITLHLVDLRLGDHRPVIGLRIARRPDFQALHARDQLLHQQVRGLLPDRHRYRYRHAAFAGRA